VLVKPSAVAREAMIYPQNESLDLWMQKKTTPTEAGAVKKQLLCFVKVAD